VITETACGGTWTFRKNSVILADLEAADNPMIENSNLYARHHHWGRAGTSSIAPLNVMKI